ncbi:MAG: hypothetical protein QOD53_1559 [Thermoleophilaceae bacterium]|nr:hypothetical protein [Thermoleophilaceae bacterium]
MRLREAGVICAAAVALACAAPAAQAAGSFQVGAAKIDITPPKFDAAHDEPEFASCPPGMTGARAFRFIEPYVDVNGNGQYDYGDPATSTPPEPFCDANMDQRHEDVYLSGAVNSPAKTVHDPIDARAIAFSDGTSTYVVASVMSQGLFDEPYIDEMRQKAKDMTTGPGSPGITDMIVSANHNEGSPDPIGIYGGPQPNDNVPAGLRSGIDEYYMTWLEGQVAKAAADAYHAMKPATLWARQVPVPPNLHVRLSKNFPTTYDKHLPNGDGDPAAIDPKVGILEARDSKGNPIATVMSLAAHNQEAGQHNSSAVTADWPGTFHPRLEALRGKGMAMFLGGDMGSEEDPETVPPVPINSPADQYKKAQASGEGFAKLVAAEAPKAVRLPFGQPDLRTTTLYAPIENNVFKAAIAAGLFGKRPGYTNGQATGQAGTDLKTFVNVLDLGPQFQFITNPGEAFPALMLGSPFGIDDATCPNRPNPAVPTWHGHAAFRFQMGLAGDMIGYMLPPWAYFENQQGVFTTDQCDTTNLNGDPKGHDHKLESEGVGPTASGMVANALTDLLDRDHPDKTAQIGPGRFVKADGTVQKRPEGAVAIWLADKGATSLTPGKGRLVAIGGVTGFGSQSIAESGRMMDYDGIDQTASDITTRGMVRFACDGSVARRYYVDVYPALAAPAKIAPATRGSIGVGCGAGLPKLGTPGNPSIGPPLVGAKHACRDRKPPSSKLSRASVRLRRGRVSVRGHSKDHGCHGKLGAILVSVARISGHRCRFLQPNGRLGAARKCRRPILLRARGTRKWRLATRARLKSGPYRVLVRAVDRSGNRERPSRRNHIRLRVR